MPENKQMNMKVNQNTQHNLKTEAFIHLLLFTHEKPEDS